LFIRFSEEARKALKDAQEEARRLNSSFVGREHLVLAMLNEDTRAYSIIDSLGADADNIRSSIEDIPMPMASSLQYPNYLVKLEDFWILPVKKHASSLTPM